MEIFVKIGAIVVFIVSMIFMAGAFMTHEENEMRGRHRSADQDAVIAFSLLLFNVVLYVAAVLL